MKSALERILNIKEKAKTKIILKTFKSRYDNDIFDINKRGYIFTPKTEKK